MSQKLRISLLLGLLITLVTGVLTAEAQDAPRPTPTPSVNSPGQDDPVDTHPDAGNNKSIRGSVYIDVNSDGVCVNSGVDGEVPVQNINIDFISSAGENLVTLQSGENGTYGLVNAGDSYWEVVVDPDNTWIVTSQNPLYASISDDTPVQIGIDFCVQKVDAYMPPTTLPIVSPPVLLPEAGAAQQSGNIALMLVAITGMGLVLLGTGLKMRERAVARQR